MEAAKNYAGSVLEKTVGFQFGKQEYHDTMIDLKSYPHQVKNSRIVAVESGLLQIVLPEFINRSLKDCTPENNEPMFNIITKMLSSVGFDLSLTAACILISNGSAAEALTLKFIANAATHTGMDLTESAVKRLKTFRPSTGILAA